jgi:hypothetical protein
MPNKILLKYTVRLLPSSTNCVKGELSGVSERSGNDDEDGDWKYCFSVCEYEVALAETCDVFVIRICDGCLFLSNLADLLSGVWLSIYEKKRVKLKPALIIYQVMLWSIIYF